MSIEIPLIGKARDIKIIVFLKFLFRDSESKGGVAEEEGDSLK